MTLTDLCFAEGKDEASGTLWSRTACGIYRRKSRRETARNFGIDRRTADKMLLFVPPPGYRRKKQPVRPKLDAFNCHRKIR